MDGSREAAKQTCTTERIARVTRWAPSLLSLRVTKPRDYRFLPGHYARLGLAGPGGGSLWRPYSIVSSPAEGELEFLVTLVPDGPFTSRLGGTAAGADILLEPRALGFFCEHRLAAGNTLWMLATGAGVGPYVSMLREGGVFRRYGRITLAHSARRASELAYREEFERLAAAREGSFRYVPIATREPGATVIDLRIPEAIASGALEALAEDEIDVGAARVMACGNPEFTVQTRRLLHARGFRPCQGALSGTLLLEQYW